MHEQKKARERDKESPDLGLIEHWGTEIENWKQQIRKAEERFQRRR